MRAPESSGRVFDSGEKRIVICFLTNRTRGVRRAREGLGRRSRTGASGTESECLAVSSSPVMSAARLRKKLLSMLHPAQRQKQQHDAGNEHRQAVDEHLLGPHRVVAARRDLEGFQRSTPGCRRS